jgi:hypothetical protein
VEFRPFRNDFSVVFGFDLLASVRATKKAKAAAAEKDGPDKGDLGEDEDEEDKDTEGRNCKRSKQR